MKKSVCVFVFIQLCFWVFNFHSLVCAQNESKTTLKRQYFSQFSTNEGQYRYNIDCISQDSEGYIYTCTQNGLHIFNGYSFKKINQDSHPDFSNKVFSVISLGDGKILIGTLDKGLYVYDKHLENITNLTPYLHSLEKLLEIRYLFTDQDNMIWAGCADGKILMLKKEELKNLPNGKQLACQLLNPYPGNAINAICEWNNKIYFGTTRGLISIEKQNIDNPSFLKVFSSPAKQPQVLSLHVNNNRL